jgi:hypothetical protein
MTENNIKLNDLAHVPETKYPIKCNIVFSAGHDILTITDGSQLEMFCDYFDSDWERMDVEIGFITYPCPGYHKACGAEKCDSCVDAKRRFGVKVSFDGCFARYDDDHYYMSPGDLGIFGKYFGDEPETDSCITVYRKKNTS